MFMLLSSSEQFSHQSPRIPGNSLLSANKIKILRIQTTVMFT